LQQYYPECAQLNIVGGGSRAPSGSELVSFPGAYSDSDPGLAVNVYANSAQTQTCYTIPGPPLYSGATATVSSLPACGGGAASNTNTGTATGTKSSSSASSAPTTGGAGHYAQCGGTGSVFLARSSLASSSSWYIYSYTGPTTCASPYTCTASSQYYSQCL
jgi:cellulase